MNEREKVRLINKISDEILELVDSAEDMPRSDVQGAAEAIALKIVNTSEAIAIKVASQLKAADAA